MSILVCGGAGYIGSHAVHQLVAKGEEVVIVDNLQSGHRDALHPQAKFYEEDYGISENGEDYDQTVYYADFEGRLVNPKRLNAYTWTAELESLSYLNYMDDYIVEEEDGWRILYRYADAVGLENCKTVYFYAPGAPVYRLPESFVSWYVCVRPLEDTALTLPGWGMMNGEEGQGFAS